MSNKPSFIKRRPVLSYYVLTFLLSYAAPLFIMITRGLPATRQDMGAMVQVLIPFMLLGPSISGVALTGLVDGRNALDGQEK